MVIGMKDKKEMKKMFDENYLTFISIAVGSVALIAAIVWGITMLLKKRDYNNS